MFRTGTTDYERIASAIRYLETHWRDQPSLADVARHVGLSESHFQRLFTRWAGISPKRFLQQATAQFARSLLRDHRAALPTTLDAGLSNPSRLHELIVAARLFEQRDRSRFHCAKMKSNFRTTTNRHPKSPLNNGLFFIASNSVGKTEQKNSYKSEHQSKILHEPEPFMENEISSNKDDDGVQNHLYNPHHRELGSGNKNIGKCRDLVKV